MPITSKMYLNSSLNMTSMGNMNNNENDTTQKASKMKSLFNNTILSNLNTNNGTSATASTPNFKPFQPFDIKYGQTQQSTNMFGNHHHHHYQQHQNNKSANVSLKKNYISTPNASLLANEHRFNPKGSIKLRSETSSPTMSSTTDKYLQKLLHNKHVNAKNSGKVLKRTNIEKSKKISNLGIIQSFNLVEKEKYRQLIEQNMCKSGSSTEHINRYASLYDQNSYSNLVKTTPKQVLDDNEFSNEKFSLPVSNLVTMKNFSPLRNRRVSSTFSTQSLPTQRSFTAPLNDTDKPMPQIIVINEKKNSVLKTSNNANQQLPPVATKQKPAKQQMLTNGTSLTSLNRFESKTSTSSLLANRLIAPTRKTTRELSDYEKSINQRTQHTNDIIESILEKCRERKYSTNTLVEEESKYNLIKRQRFEDEIKLAKQFSERLQLDTNKLSKYYYEEEEEEEDEFPELSSEQEDIIARALVNYPQDEVLTTGFNVDITRKDIQTLKGLNWLNDEIINFYMNLICERSQQTQDRRVYAFTTFFYPKLVKDGFNSLKRWTRKIDIFSYNVILVPVHLGLHWTLAVIDIDCKEIRYYDSMSGHNVECLRALRNYLRDEHQDKKSNQLDLSQWNFIHVADIPQQMNGSDCGMFTCKYAEFISRGKNTFLFNQTHMPYYRRRMIWEIINKKLV